jgi:hypothetical protein
MKTLITALLSVVMLIGMTADSALAVELEAGKEYYVKTALHAVRGNEIYWVNYTDSAKTLLIKAGEKVRITRLDRHIINFDLNGRASNFAFTEKAF